MAKLGTEGGGEEAFFLAVGGPFWRQIRQCWRKRGLQRQKKNGINAKEPFLIGKFLSWKTYGRRRVGGKEENPINSLKPFIPPLGGRERPRKEEEGVLGKILNFHWERRGGKGEGVESPVSKGEGGTAYSGWSQATFLVFCRVEVNRLGKQHVLIPLVHRKKCFVT